MRTRTKTNPAFYADHLRALLADDPERLARALEDPRSAELLTWNVFASLEHHSDRDWVGHRLQALGGPELRAPVRLSLWSGRRREPLLAPTRGALEHLRGRLRDAGVDDSSITDVSEPVEVPVRVESPAVLLLVDTTLGGLQPGAGGRDRIVELVDAGLEHARRLSVQLAVAIVYASGTTGAAEISDRVQRLRAPGALAAAMPWRERVPPVVLREMSWQQLLRIWEAERDYLDLDGQPVRAFLDYAAACGLR